VRLALKTARLFPNVKNVGVINNIFVSILFPYNELSSLYVILYETVLSAESRTLTADTAANYRPYNYHIGEINTELLPSTANETARRHYIRAV